MVEIISDNVRLNVFLIHLNIGLFFYLYILYL